MWGTGVWATHTPRVISKILAWGLEMIFNFSSLIFSCSSIKENTVASMKDAIQHGADMVEFDVQVTFEGNCQAQGQGQGQGQSQSQKSKVKTRPWGRGCNGLAHPPPPTHPPYNFF